MNNISLSSLFEHTIPLRLRRASGLRAAGLAIGAATLWLGLASFAAGACKIELVGELHVDAAHNRVVTDGLIDGKPVRVGIDTGSTFTFIWEDSARRLGLPVTYRGKLQIYGVGGQARPSQTVVKHLQVGKIYANNMRLIVIASAANRPAGSVDLVLGADTFADFDTEFDLAHGRIRLLKPKGCTVDELPYWTNTYSQADLESGDFLHAQIAARVLVNGRTVDAILDTGATTSVITRQAAARAGVRPWVQDPHPAATIHGLGGERVESWIGTFDSFSIGDETVRHVPLRIADLFEADRRVNLGSRIAKHIDDLPTMLIGCDFFLAHHLLVLPRERKLLFTYDGGKIFQTIEIAPPPSG